MDVFLTFIGTGSQGEEKLLRMNADTLVRIVCVM